MISRLVLLCLCGALPLIHSLPNSNRAHDSEAISIEVPLKHAIHRGKRSVNYFSDDLENHDMSFYAFGSNFTLYFEQYDHVLMGTNTPIFTAKANRNVRWYNAEVLYEEIPNAMEQLDMTAFIDDKNDAHAVRLANRMVGSFTTRNNIAYNFVVNDIANDVDPKITLTETSHDVTERIRTMADNVSEMTHSVNQEVKVTTAYPEMLVVMDNNFYELHDRKWEDVVMYVFSFWTAVDLRFRSFTNPRVRLNIAGIVIATENGGVPYKRVGPHESLIAMGAHFLNRRTNLPEADATAFMLYKNRHLINKENYIAGSAYKDKICQESGLMVFFDANKSDGINTAAHELGHLLGADDEKKKVGKCIANNEVYIMGYNDENDQNNTHHNDFSNCSKVDIQKHLMSSAAQCLYNKPNVQAALPKILPRATLDEQCIADFGPLQGIALKEGEYTVSPCKMLACASHVTDYVSSHGVPAAEGSVCDKEGAKVCLNGNCVHKPRDLSNENSSRPTLPSSTTPKTTFKPAEPEFTKPETPRPMPEWPKPLPPFPSPTSIETEFTTPKQTTPEFTTLEPTTQTPYVSPTSTRRPTVTVIIEIKYTKGGMTKQYRNQISFLRKPQDYEISFDCIGSIFCQMIITTETESLLAAYIPAL